MGYKLQNVVCQNCKQDFAIEPDDFGFYEKIKVPPPTFCPECRRQRRLTWRNDLSLYNRACNLCEKSVVTIYSKESGIKIYCNKCWWGDNWDPMKYGQDYDFSRPFFEQHKELVSKVPHLALVNDDGIASVNSEYTHDFSFAKNCYMVFVAWKVENVMYSYYASAGKDMMDCLDIKSKNEFLYECTRCATSYRLKYSQQSKNCINSQFLFNCMNCTDCFMCTLLVGKKYFFKNKQYTKEEYEKILESYKLDTFSGVEKAQQEYDEFILKYPKRYVYIFNCKNCSGDLTSYSKNSQFCFNVKKSENCKWVENSDAPRDSYDMSTGGELSECYEDITCDHSSRNLFGIFSWKSQDIQYTQHCHNSKYVFGCVGLRNASYCIFNKQYTKEEYEALVPQIIKQMNDMPYRDKKGNQYKYGEFYPAELSPFGYNETIAQEHFPLEKEGAETHGYRWQDNLQHTTGKETKKPEDIPDSITQIGDSVLDEVLACIDCERNYKIIPNELIFYRKMAIPVPRRCFYCRHAKRLKRRNPFKLWHRQCMCDKKHANHEGKCGVEFETSYAPDRPEIIYCERCYQGEVY